MKKYSRLPVCVSVLMCMAVSALAHCQVPCGIYDDAARVLSMKEHVTTIEKAMGQITKLSVQEKPEMNQIVRWVTTKDNHADELAEIVTYYFMAQRIKPAPEGDDAKAAIYTKQLSLLHGILVHAMKAKQTTDASHVDTLRAMIQEFETSYFAK